MASYFSSSSISTVFVNKENKPRSFSTWTFSAVARRICVLFFSFAVLSKLRNNWRSTALYLLPSGRNSMSLRISSRIIQLSVHLFASWKILINYDIFWLSFKLYILSQLTNFVNGKLSFFANKAAIKLLPAPLFPVINIDILPDESRRDFFTKQSISAISLSDEGP